MLRLRRQEFFECCRLYEELGVTQRPADPLSAFQALARVANAARSKTEYVKAVRAFVQHCGQPLTTSLDIDEDKLEANVDHAQLLKDLDREQVEVGGVRIDGSAYDELVAAAEKVVVAAALRGSAPGDLVPSPERLARCVRAVLISIDRTNSAGDAFFALQTLVCNFDLVTVTPAEGDQAIPLEINGMPDRGYVVCSSRNTFVVNSMDPQDEESAWLNIRCLSTVLVRVDFDDVFNGAPPAEAAGAQKADAPATREQLLATDLEQLRAMAADAGLAPAAGVADDEREELVDLLRMEAAKEAALEPKTPPRLQSLLSLFVSAELQ